MPRIFVSQQRMQQWTEDGKVSLANNIMTLPTLGKSFRLTEAIYISRLAAGGDDTHRLLGRVKTRTQLQELGAESYHDSLVIGETAYVCEPGFVGEVIGTGAVQAATTTGLQRLDD